MSVTGISSSGWSSYENPAVQNNSQQFKQEFQQLGQDLQSGNLSASQQDFSALQQLAPQSNSSSASQNNNPIAQAFSQLSQDLQAGNLSAAQTDYSQIQQDFQSQSAQHPHHHHHGGGGGGEGSQISQLFSQLGSALQSGNLSTAQQTYATLQQDLQQYEPANGQSANQQSAPSGSSNLSVNA